MPGYKKHLLVIRLSAMGDVAMTVPVLRALTLQHPSIKVTVASKAFFKPFFDGIPNISFFTVDTSHRHKGLLGIFRLYRDLKKLRVYAVADLHNVLRSKIITAFFSWRGKKTATVDKARDEKKALTRAKNKIFKPLTPITQRHAEVFKKLGFSINLSNPIFPDKAVLTEDILALTGKKEGRWIGIAPFAQHQAKVYPLDLLEQVVKTLSENLNNTIFLFGGGRTEKSLLKTIAADRSNIIVTTGRTNLAQELQLINNLDIMLSMDSSNAHIAAMQGVKVVTLWGATHPYAGFTPFNQPFENALVSDREKYSLLPTSVYGNKKVAGYEDAMRTITPQMVIDKVNHVLER